MTDQPARRPYTAKEVQYLDHGLHVSDPSVDPEEAYDKLLHRDLPYEVEVIDEATRFYKSEGADFSGWVVSWGSNYGDPIPNKREAMKHLRWAVAERFAPKAGA